MITRALVTWLIVLLYVDVRSFKKQFPKNLVRKIDTVNETLKTT